MRKVLVFLLFCYLIIACTTESCDISGRYNFKLPVSLSPELDTFRIGDTISIVSVFDHNVYEIKTGNRYQLNNWQFYPEAVVVKLDTIQVDYNAARHFDFYADSLVNFAPFTYGNGSIRYVGQYTYADHNYSLSFHIIPQKVGLYGFDIFSLLYPHNQNQDFEGRCRNKSSEAFMEMNKGIGNNSDLIYYTQDTALLNELDEDLWKESATYLFYVVD